jgi:hydroxymethylbilane synthase
MGMTRLRLATRGSALALTQSGMVAEALRQTWPDLDVELVVLLTSGDERDGRDPRRPDTDKSRFVKEIDEALLRGDADLAVHSAKDLPGQLAEGLAIVAVPERADARDALCGAAGIDRLLPGATVGTASLRRRAQLLAARPDLRVVDLRGNVDTRLCRLREGRFDAIVLAAAGLARLGMPAGMPISPDVIVPAPGQGCLAITVRAGDSHATALAEPLDHTPSHRQLLAERTVARRLGADCQTPFGVHARPANYGSLKLAAFAGPADGGPAMRASLMGSALAPEKLGIALADRLLAMGADRLFSGEEAA